MANLGAILNIPSDREKEWRKDSMIPTSATSLTSPTSPDFTSSMSTEQPPAVPPPGGALDHYRYRVNAAGEHEAHSGCPDSLSCLVDTNERPLYTIPVLISCAILGSPDKKMLVSEIYQSIMEKYPYFTSSESVETRFKQSLRHQLSLNRLFEREQGQRLLTRGFYWSVNLAAPPGTKRPRKRGSRKPDDPELAAPKKDLQIKDRPMVQDDLGQGAASGLAGGGGAGEPPPDVTMTEAGAPM
ncbi:unnamed protein product [Peniophora sp. CBMAI 1063]|nr:unnamed protein product [Peniophora sp. CBMAI 1063]